MRQDVAALAVAERWPATRRADYLAYQAEFWRSFPSESLVTLGPARDSLFARARRLAGDALALDPANLQALETTAALMSGVPRYRDPLAEAGIRQRIVELRPGDLAELEPYFHLVDAIMRDPATRRDEIREHAEAVRLRYVRILDLCLRVWRHPSLAALRQRWANPLPIP